MYFKFWNEPDPEIQPGYLDTS